MPTPCLCSFAGDAGACSQPKPNEVIYFTLKVKKINKRKKKFLKKCIYIYKYKIGFCDMFKHFALHPFFYMFK